MMPAPEPAHDQPAEDEVVAHLRNLVGRDDARADELAKAGGEERQIAAHHQRRAQEFDERAVAARANADRWRNHLSAELAGQAAPAVHLVAVDTSDAPGRPALPPATGKPTPPEKHAAVWSAPETGDHQ